jgi:8-oxo-dGTP pyrophosphatase MutT (NUDIX family)
MLRRGNTEQFHLANRIRARKSDTKCGTLKFVAKNSAGLLKRNVFWIVSRVAFWCYRHAPIFGSLRASLGVIRNASCVLVIRRNDGRGLSFPGGLALPWETEEKTLIREIKEETGLLCERFEFAFRYESCTDIPARIAVFHVQATGEIHDSWEGTPEWVEVADLRQRVVRSQQYIVERLLVTTTEPQAG